MATTDPLLLFATDETQATHYDEGTIAGLGKVNDSRWSVDFLLWLDTEDDDEEEPLWLTNICRRKFPFIVNNNTNQTKHKERYWR